MDQYIFYGGVDHYISYGCGRGVGQSPKKFLNKMKWQKNCAKWAMQNAHMEQIEKKELHNLTLEKKKHSCSEKLTNPPEKYNVYGVVHP